MQYILTGIFYFRLTGIFLREQCVKIFIIHKWANFKRSYLGNEDDLEAHFETKKSQVKNGHVHVSPEGANLIREALIYAIVQIQLESSNVGIQLQIPQGERFCN